MPGQGRLPAVLSVLGLCGACWGSAMISPARAGVHQPTVLAIPPLAAPLQERRQQEVDNPGRPAPLMVAQAAKNTAASSEEHGAGSSHRAGGFRKADTREGHSHR